MAPGLLTRGAWQVLETAGEVLARDDGEPLASALAEAGVAVGHLGDPPAPDLARALVEKASAAAVVWVGSADGDPGLTDAVAAEVSRRQEPPEVEVVVGSWDVPGGRVLDLIAVMDRLRSPGGCPWDAQQTHESLVKYLIEEAHEAAEAIEAGDRRHMVEELGDVLLQVAFQSRVGQEHREDPFDLDDVAGAIVAKLVRRHPHVFADGDASTPEEVEAAWDVIKSQERGHPGGEAGHESLLHGIPASLSTLLAAEKALARHARRGGQAPRAGDDLGTRLLALVEDARRSGKSADAELRRALRELDTR